MTALDFSRTLPRLAERIRSEHEAAEQAWQSAVQHAIHAGEMLAEVKARLPHGEWGRWLRENFPATQQTATGYMRLARHAGQIENAPSIREALKSIATPRFEPEPEPEPGPRRVESHAHDDADAEEVNGEAMSEPDRGEEPKGIADALTVDPLEERRDRIVAIVEALVEPVQGVVQCNWSEAIEVFDPREVQRLHKVLSSHAENIDRAAGWLHRLAAARPEPAPVVEPRPPCGKERHAGFDAWRLREGPGPWRCAECVPCHAPADATEWRAGMRAAA